MNLTAINSAMQAAYDAALVNPLKQAPTQVGDDPNQTVQVVIYQAPTGSGFRVIGRIKVGGYVATKVLNHGPDTGSARDWPVEGIEAAAAAHVSRCVQAGEALVERSGFSAARLVTLMDLLMTTKEANALGSRPKLVALYTGLQTVKQTALAGSITFPPAPHTFEEVVSES